MIIPDRTIKTLDELADLDIQILLDNNVTQPPVSTEDIYLNYAELVFGKGLGQIGIERFGVAIEYLNQFFNLLKTNSNIAMTPMISQECKCLYDVIRRKYVRLKDSKKRKNQRLELVGELSDSLKDIKTLMQKRSKKLNLPDTEELTKYLREIHDQEADIDLVSQAILSDKYSAIISNDQHIPQIMRELRTRYFNPARGQTVPPTLKERLSLYSAGVFSLELVPSENEGYELKTDFRGGF
jgi:hypothetical protein